MRRALWAATIALTAVPGLAGEAAAPPPEVPAARPRASTAITPERAREVFEQLKGLAGRWRGKSTRGWEEESDVRVIAGGSVVELASFDAHPGEQMRTMFHLDGGRLMITHYCVAGNQPRLVAASEDGDGILFDFLDLTGTRPAEKGHMRRARFRILGPDRLVARWTWWQAGQERWMEEIHMERVR